MKVLKKNRFNKFYFEKKVLLCAVLAVFAGGVFYSQNENVNDGVLAESLEKTESSENSEKKSASEDSEKLKKEKAEDSKAKKEEYYRCRYIGRVFQNPTVGVAPNMNILENMSLADNKGKPYGMKFAIDKKRINYYKEELKKLNLGLEDKLYNKVNLLSGGQRQALTLIMAVMSNPKILLLDEHTAALDPKTSIKIMDITDKIIDEKKITTLMVTHNIKQAIESGDRLIMMHEGKIMIDVKREEKSKLNRDKLIEMFGRANMKDVLSDRSLLSTF